MYEFSGNIRYSEVDSEGRLTLLKLLDYFQDCSVFHSESLGVGVEYLAKNNIAWVLTSWQVRVEKMPSLTDKVRIQTWPYEMKGFFGFRNFAMVNEAGERLAYANSVWVLVDTESGRPTKISKELAGVYDYDPQIEMGDVGRKLREPKEFSQEAEIVVPSYFIDTNQHMNNSKYVAVACEFLPDDAIIKELRVEYRKSAMQGDIMIPRVTKTEDGITVALVGPDNKAYALVQFLI